MLPDRNPDELRCQHCRRILGEGDGGEPEHIGHQLAGLSGHAVRLRTVQDHRDLGRGCECTDLRHLLQQSSEADRVGPTHTDHDVGGRQGGPGSAEALRDVWVEPAEVVALHARSDVDERPRHGLAGTAQHLVKGGGAQLGPSLG